VDPRTRRQADDLLRRCRAGLDATTLRREVLQRLRRIVPIDAGFFATIDPATLLFTSAVSEDPLIEASSRFLANELEGKDVNRFVDIAAATIPVRWLDQVTLGRRHDSARYSSIMRPLGLGDELRVALRSGETCWGVMCLHREDGSSGFNDREAAIIADLAPHIAEGLRRATLIAGFETAAAPARHGVVVLDADACVVSMNEAAERWLAEIAEEDWSTGGEVPLPILSAALAVADPDDEEADAPTIRVRTINGSWLAIHASRLFGTASDQTVVVLDPAEPGELFSLILDAHGITPRQARVVALVLRGYSTQQIVNELHISSHTVQEHLKAVFDKLGVRSRRELAATLLHR